MVVLEVMMVAVAAIVKGAAVRVVVVVIVMMSGVRASMEMYSLMWMGMTEREGPPSIPEAALGVEGMQKPGPLWSEFLAMKGGPAETASSATLGVYLAGTLVSCPRVDSI